MKLTELASGLQFPEGPVILDDGSVLFVEVASGDIKRYSKASGLTTLAHVGAGPNGAAMGPGGDCYVVNNGGFRWIDDPKYGLRPNGPAPGFRTGYIQRVNLNTGRHEVIYDSADGRPLTGPNDIVFDEHGGFWFTDFGKVWEDKRVRDIGSVFYAKADGSFIEEVIHPMTTPNGIALSPDGRWLYVAETETARLWRFKVTAPGQIEKSPWPSPHGGELVYASGGRKLVRYDSMAVEASGAVCIGTLFDGGITTVEPSGELLEFRKIDDHFVTNICFGGPEFRKAYVTLAGCGKLVEIDWPRPGLPLHFGGR
jgi:gluconolactonase